MGDSALRLRVERLLRDDFRVEDLTTLFLALRDSKADGREAVIEVGDFIAHRATRNKGIMTNCVRDFFVMVRHKMPPGTKKPVDLTDIPKNFIDVMWATFRRLDAKIITRDTGLKRHRVHDILRDITKRFRRDNSGRCYLAWPTSEDQIVMRSLTRYVISSPAFDEGRLFDEFSDVLISNDLLSRKELKQLLPLKATLGLYAVCCMHQTTVDLGDDTYAHLAAAPNVGTGNIGVYARADSQHPSGKIFVETAMFLTTATATPTFCEPALLIEPAPHIWPFHLELTNRKTIAKLG